MSAENEQEGWACYASGQPETREWFERQWRIWPERADEACTTNISFLYGGVVAFREEHGCDPELSSDFHSHVAWHDAHPTRAHLMNTITMVEGDAHS